jgi:hypothetical protein
MRRRFLAAAALTVVAMLAVAALLVALPLVD